MSLTPTFRDFSISLKLSVLIVLTSGLGLILSGVGFLIYEAAEYHRSATRENTALSEIIATSSTAALSFGDVRAENETLASLRGDPRKLEATVYDSSNRFFATYRNPVVDLGAPAAKPGPDGSRFVGDLLILTQPIKLGQQRIGTVVLKVSMKAAYTRLSDTGGFIGVMLVASLAGALLLATHLRRTITEPLAELSRVAQRISVGKDYSIRARKFGKDETGAVADSFNQMLSQIQAQEEARIKSELVLRDSEERYALAALGSNDGLWDWKLPSNKIYFSPRWEEMLGYSAGELKADPEEWFVRIHPGDREKVRAEMAGRAKEAPEIFSIEYRIRRKSGTYIWALCRGIIVRDTAGRIVRIAGSQTDITEGRILDSLTGLRNRIYFIDKLDACLAAAREGDHPFAVLFLDLDRFKVVNDSLGHAAGDRLLIDFAARLQSGVRSSDLTARSANLSVVARFGGDEFAILLEGIRHPEDAAGVAGRILEHLEPPFLVANHPVFVSVSIGIAMGDSAKTGEDLLRNADAAMYSAKTKGKARYEVFNEGMRDRAVARLELETDLRKALDEEQFVVYYQPEVVLRTGKTIGYEALIRWQHPQRGLIQPGEFIQTAEDTGLIIPIGRWILNHACRQMAEWHKILPPDSRPTISVNMSVKQLADPRFVEDVARALSESGLNPPSLRLELTESSIMENKDRTLSVLRSLKELNVGLELDDFGTGYSSLSYLHELPFDAVKIDRSFINGIPARKGSTKMVETILGMARSLKLEVVAEGVETNEQRNQLIALGCPFAQGFLYSKPIDAEMTTNTMNKQHAIPGFAKLPAA